MHDQFVETMRNFFYPILDVPSVQICLLLLLLIFLFCFLFFKKNKLLLLSPQDFKFNFSGTYATHQVTSKYTRCDLSSLHGTYNDFALNQINCN